MFKDKLLKLAFFISLAAHGIILFQNPNFSFLPSGKKDLKVEVTYLKQSREVKQDPGVHLTKNEPFLKMDRKIVADSRSAPPFIDKEKIFKSSSIIRPNSPDFNKPTLSSPDAVSIRRKINLPPVDSDKMNNPSYISYYQIVREKIKRAAYQNYTHQDIGEVYLSFIASKDGFLKEARVFDEKSSHLQYLKDIALRSLKDASPFPAFPKDLDYPSLSFNIVISFEIE